MPLTALANNWHRRSQIVRDCFHDSRNFVSEGLTSMSPHPPGGFECMLRAPLALHCLSSLYKVSLGRGFSCMMTQIKPCEERNHPNRVLCTPLSETLFPPPGLLQEDILNALISNCFGELARRQKIAESRYHFKLVKQC